MFLKNKNIIFKIRRSKVTDYAALSSPQAAPYLLYQYVLENISEYEELSLCIS